MGVDLSSLGPEYERNLSLGIEAIMAYLKSNAPLIPHGHIYTMFVSLVTHSSVILFFFLGLVSHRAKLKSSNKHSGLKGKGL